MATHFRAPILLSWTLILISYLNEGMENPTKTFGLSAPMDVFMKLEFDLKRLGDARSTKDVQFAALDLAVWGFHMIDWVLNSVTDERHLELTGCERSAKGIVPGFVNKQSTKLKNISFCRQIANTGKHRVLTQSPDDPSFRTNHTIHFDPPFHVGQKYSGSISSAAYLQHTASGQKIAAVDFFNSMVEQWREFLKTEELYNWDYDYEPSVDPTLNT